MGKLVIIGTGLAGYTLAREFRKRDSDTELLIISADDGASYSKPMLSNALDKGKSPDELIMADADKMATDLNATIWTETRVQSMDANKQQLQTDKGSVDYDRLVLANGAYSFMAPMDGDAVDQVMTVNSLTDYREFRQRLKDKGQRVVLIGAGLIGCEFANDLSTSGATISIVDMAPQPLGRLLSSQAAGILQDKLSELGVSWHLDNVVKTVNQNGEALRVTLKDGTELDCDVVLSAIGLRADLSLAESAGLDTDRGIKVNRLLQTSDEHIYALGDCAQVEDLNLPFVMPLMTCARALAATLAGEDTPVKYPAMPVVVKTPCYPIVVCPPPRKTDGDWEEQVEENGIRAFFKDDSGKVHGFVLTGDLTKERLALSKQIDDWLA